MARVSATISNETEQLLSGAIEAGLYTGRSDAVRDAIRSFVDERPELAKEIAVELYLQDKVELLTASRLAQVSVRQFRTLLDDREEA